MKMIKGGSPYRVFMPTRYWLAGTFTPEELDVDHEEEEPLDHLVSDHYWTPKRESE